METSKLMEGHNILFNNYKTTYINNLNLTEIKPEKWTWMLPSATRPKCHTENSVLLFDFLTLTKQHMNHAKAHIFSITIYPFSFFLNPCQKLYLVHSNNHAEQFAHRTICLFNKFAKHNEIPTKKK